jgi:hypothetical protein
VLRRLLSALESSKREAKIIIKSESAQHIMMKLSVAKLAKEEKKM